MVRKGVTVQYRVERRTSFCSDRDGGGWLNRRAKLEVEE